MKLSFVLLFSFVTFYSSVSASIDAWDASKDYNIGVTVVVNEGANAGSYRSIKSVPANQNIDITNTEYWFNLFLEANLPDYVQAGVNPDEEGLNQALSSGTPDVSDIPQDLPPDTDNNGGDTSTGGGDTSTGGGDTSSGGGDTSSGGGDTSTGGGDTSSGGGDTSTGGGDTNSGGGDTSTGSGDTNSGGYTSGTPKIVRMSVRGHIGTADDERFMRFAVNGDVNVLVRAIGPALGDLNADLGPISLLDPKLSMFKGQDELPAFHNDNYTDRSEASQIKTINDSLGLVIPIKPVESASLGDYSTGTYYANVRDNSYSSSYGTRVGWVGADITDTNASGGFSGVSTRGVIKPGDGSMFASFEIVGDANSTRRMFIRARGASLANFGVKNVLSNINLKLFYLGGDLIKQNNDYTSESNKGEIEIQAKALFGDLDSTDAGMIIDLKPAYYTIWAESETGSTGVGWIGIDDITQE